MTKTAVTVPTAEQVSALAAFATEQVQQTITKLKQRIPELTAEPLSADAELILQVPEALAKVINHYARLLQDVLADPTWSALLAPADRRGLTPLFWSHVRPYGEVRLALGSRGHRHPRTRRGRAVTRPRPAPPGARRWPPAAGRHRRPRTARITMATASSTAARSLERVPLSAIATINTAAVPATSMQATGTKTQAMTSITVLPQAASTALNEAVMKTVANPPGGRPWMPDRRISGRREPGHRPSGPEPPDHAGSDQHSSGRGRT